MYTVSAIELTNTIMELICDSFKVAIFSKDGTHFIEASQTDLVDTDEGKKGVTFTVQVPLEHHKNLLQVDANPFLSERYRLDKMRL